MPPYYTYAPLLRRFLVVSIALMLTVLEIQLVHGESTYAQLLRSEGEEIIRGVEDAALHYHQQLIGKYDNLWFVVRAVSERFSGDTWYPAPDAFHSVWKDFVDVLSPVLPSALQRFLEGADDEVQGVLTLGNWRNTTTPYPLPYEDISYVASSTSIPSHAGGKYHSNKSSFTYYFYEELIIHAFFFYSFFYLGVTIVDRVMALFYAICMLGMFLSTASYTLLAMLLDRTNDIVRGAQRSICNSYGC